MPERRILLLYYLLRSENTFVLFSLSWNLGTGGPRLVAVLFQLRGETLLRLGIYFEPEPNPPLEEDVLSDWSVPHYHDGNILVLTTALALLGIISLTEQ